MKIEIIGDVAEYYVQTLCLLFFPGAKFSKKETDDSHKASVVVEKQDGMISSTVTIVYNDKTSTKKAEESYGNGISERAGIRIAVGKAFLAAGKSVTGVSPQWGILTGVRPSKLALKEFEDKKSTKAEVKSFFQNEYLVYLKKASLLVDIASLERKIINACPKDSCSVYISIPFCPSRCSYCSFVSFTSNRLLSIIDDYMIKLVDDIKKTFAIIRELGLDLKTVYVGGGTPTTLNKTQLQLLIDTINNEFDVSKLEEFTVEAGRPDTITAEKLSILKNGGVTRISINPQTLNSEVLEIIGRKHTVEQFYKAFEMAKESGIEQINTDLIAGLPYDGFRSFSETIDNIIQLRPSNITVHTLCIKNAADFAREKDSIYPPANVASKCVDYSQLATKNAGYVPYYIYRQKNTIENLENVGFCLPGCEGRYNIYMMEEVHSIFACGAGAVTKCVSPERDNIVRVFNFKYPYEYLSDTDNSKINNKFNTIRDFYQKIKENN